MKRKTVFLLFIFGIVFLVIFILKLVRDRTPRTGVLKVNSIPQSTIFIDNKQMGKTPFEDKLKEGEYTIKLLPETTVQQISPWQGRIKITQNLLTFINAELTDLDLSTAVDTLWLEKIAGKQAEVSIVTIPDGVQVMLDGQSKGVSPVVLTDIDPADHTVIFSSPGFVSRTLKIKTTSGYRLLINTKLSISGSQKTEEENVSSPSGILSQIEPTIGQISISVTPKISVSPTIKSKPVATPSASIKPTPTEESMEKPYIIIKETPTGFLRVRMEPSIQATEAARVKPGEKFTLFDTKNGWYKIKYTTENYGWISGQYAEKVE